MPGNLKKICGAAVVLFFAGFPLHLGYAEGPDSVELSTLAQYYDAVQFEHAMHVEMLGDKSCATCHHHTVGTQLVDDNCRRCHENGGETASAACVDCHPVKRFSAEYLLTIEEDIHLYHVDKPGLKGAYHQRCLGCHKEMDASIGCHDCHARNEAGDKLFSSGAFAPAPGKTTSKH